MITTLWTIGLILFALSGAFMHYSTTPSAFRSYHKWEFRALLCMIGAIVVWGVAMFVTPKQTYERSVDRQSINCNVEVDK